MSAIKIVVVTMYESREETARTWVSAEKCREAFRRNPSVAQLDPDAFQGGINAPKDVVRARSRAASLALKLYPEATHVLWWDDDVFVRDFRTIGAMVQSPYDVVGCTYPRKRVDWDRVDAAEHMAETHAYDYPYRIAGADGATVNAQPDEWGCIEATWLPAGMLVTTTRALRAMIEFYREEDWFTETNEAGELEEYVAIFGMVYTAPKEINGQRFRELPSEDNSFCERYARMRGSRVWPGAAVRALGAASIPAFAPLMMHCNPVDHLGGYAYRGHPAGLRYAR